MAEILLSKHPYHLDSLDNIHDMYSLQLKHKPRTGPPILIPYRPYLHSTRPSTTDENILVTLDHHLPKKDITDMAFEFGDENTIAIAEIAAGLRDYGAAATGAATTIYSRRMQSFGTAVKRYQDALLDYRAVVRSNPAAASAARQEAINAFQNMQKVFRGEINVVKSGIRRSRGLTLTRPNRALDIARSNRRVAKLHVFDEVQATRLVRFGKYGRYLGNGLAVIDFGIRVNHIHDSYKAGENWYREMFIESSGFAASATTAVLMAEVGSSALVCLAALTPPGWVLIIAGIAAAGVAAGASIVVNNVLKENSGSWYDSIMKWTNGK